MNEPREIRIQIIGPSGEYISRYRHQVNEGKVIVFEETLAALFLKWSNEGKGRKL